MSFPILSKFRPHRRGFHKPRLFVDASSFDPGKIQPNGPAVIVVARDAAEIIETYVRQEQARAAGVVVLDQGSRDQTPYLAARAGAVVVIQEQESDADAALCRAVEVAHQFSRFVDVVEVE